jgi:hypothetical protein
MFTKKAFIMATGVTMLSVAAHASTNQAASVLTSPPGFADEYFQVDIAAIDGENIPARQWMELEPGSYEITVNVPARYTEPVVTFTRNAWSEQATFRLEAMPGVKYRIRGVYNRTDRDNPYDIEVEPVPFD